MGCSFIAGLQSEVGKVADIASPIVASIPGPWQIPAMVYIANNTIKSGGDIGDVALKIGTAYFAGQLGAGASESVANSLMGNGMSVAAVEGIGGIVGGATSGAFSGGVNALASGRDPIDAILKGGLSGGLTAGAMQGIGSITSSIPGFDKLGKDYGAVGAAAQRAVNSALAAEVLGKDVNQSILNSVLNSAVSTGKEYLKDLSQPVQEAWDKLTQTSTAYKDNVALQNEIVAQYEATRNASNSNIEAQRATLQANMDGYNQSVDRIAEIDRAIAAGTEDYSTLMAVRGQVQQKANGFAGAIDAAMPGFNASQTAAQDTLKALSDKLDTTKAALEPIQKQYDAQQTALNVNYSAYQAQEQTNTQVLAKQVSDATLTKNSIEQITGKPVNQEQLDKFIQTGDPITAAKAYYASQGEDSKATLDQLTKAFEEASVKKPTTDTTVASINTGIKTDAGNGGIASLNADGSIKTVEATKPTDTQQVIGDVNGEGQQIPEAKTTAGSLVQQLYPEEIKLGDQTGDFPEKIEHQADGATVVTEADGTQRIFKADGTVEIIGADGTKTTEGNTGANTVKYDDGSTITTGADGTVTSTEKTDTAYTPKIENTDLSKLSSSLLGNLTGALGTSGTSGTGGNKGTTGGFNLGNAGTLLGGAAAIGGAAALANSLNDSGSNNGDSNVLFPHSMEWDITDPAPIQNARAYGQHMISPIYKAEGGLLSLTPPPYMQSPLQQYPTGDIPQQSAGSQPQQSYGQMPYTQPDQNQYGQMKPQYIQPTISDGNHLSVNQPQNYNADPSNSISMFAGGGMPIAMNDGGLPSIQTDGAIISNVAQKYGLGEDVRIRNKIEALISQGMNPDEAARLVAGSAKPNQMAMGAPMNRLMASGGISTLGHYSDGGRMLKGPGDGMSDDIPATIADKQPARLANEEFVIPADVVSHLGNGSSEAGAKVLYDMMARVREARTGNSKQGKQIHAEKFMPKMRG